MFETFDIYEELIKGGLLPTLFFRFEKRTQKYTIGNVSGTEMYEIREIKALQQMWVDSATEKKHWVDIKEVDNINGSGGAATFDTVKFS